MNSLDLSSSYDSDSARSFYIIDSSDREDSEQVKFYIDNGSLLPLYDFDISILLERFYIEDLIMIYQGILLEYKIILVFNNYEEMPEPIQSLCRRDGTNSFMFNIITIDGKESFILYFLRQHSSKPWTKNEQKIMHYTSKMFTLLLEDYARKHPLSTSIKGGAQ